jgi:hypothetical protein
MGVIRVVLFLCSFASPALAQTSVQIECDNVTDNGVAIQAAVNALPSFGGDVVLQPVGSLLCMQATTVVVLTPNVSISARGQGNEIHNVGSIVAQCPLALSWNGVTYGWMFRWSPPNAGAGTQYLAGGSLKGVCLLGNGIAGVGVEIESQRRGVFRDLYLENFIYAAIDLNVIGAALGEPSCTQFNEFSQIAINQFAVTGAGIRLNQNSFCNVSFNSFYGLDIGHHNGPGILDVGGDDNSFFTTRIYRAAAGTGYSIDWRVSGAGTSAYPANTETFYSLSTTAAAIARTGTYGITIFSLDKGNGSPNPIREAGAQVSCTASSGKAC